MGLAKALSLIGSCRCSFACLPILATGTCEPPTGMLQYNSHYPCHKQRWNLQWIQSMLSGAFDLGTKRVTAEPPCKLVNKQRCKANNAIADKHSNGCWRLHYIKTPQHPPLQANYIQISTPSVKQEIVLGQTAIYFL